ncbi:PhnH Uncharacterized enzyme of phosphonate metabolism [Rhabdaerophilaceae bacterium]
MTVHLSPGFSDPVRDQQRAFRVAMDALSRPARIIRFVSQLSNQGSLCANSSALALTLLDFEVRYHLAPSLMSAESALTFHTGSIRVDRPDLADFAFLDLRQDPMRLDSFAQGVPNYPDRSTTLVVSCAALTGGPEYSVRGPGISAIERLSVQGLPDDFAEQWVANSARMPLGVDVLFVSGNGVLGLPRSTRLVGGAG